MNIELELSEVADLKPRICVIGVGGAGCNAINNMIATGLDGVEFIAANTDAQALAMSAAERRLQLGAQLTEGLGAGAKPEIGHQAAEEAADEIRSMIEGCHMVFLAAGMGGGTGTGAVSVIARMARELNILTVAIVSKPFQFEGARRMRTAEAGISELRGFVDTLIVIPNQNLFRIANEKTTFAEAFILADQVLYSGIACIVDLIIKDGLINLDFADVKAVMQGMGAAVMGTGEAAGENRASAAAEQAIANPLLDELTLKGARGLLVSIIGGRNLTLFEVDEAASRVRQEADPEANIIVGASFEDGMDDRIRVSIVASGLGGQSIPGHAPAPPTLRQAPPGYAAPPPPAMQPVPPPVTSADQVPSVAADQPPGESSGAASRAAAGGRAADIPPPPPPPPGMNLAPPPPDANPYLGDTTVDEFARALSEVMGTVDDGDEPAAPSDSAWRSADGVVIEEGLESAAAAAPPPLPPAAPEVGDVPTGAFTPKPPAELPRRVPDIGEFPTFAQQSYQAPSATTPARQPGLLKRIAGFGRQGRDLADSPASDSPPDRSSARASHSAGETHENDANKATRQALGARRRS